MRQNASNRGEQSTGFCCEALTLETSGTGSHHPTPLPIHVIKNALSGRLLRRGADLKTRPLCYKNDVRAPCPTQRLCQGDEGQGLCPLQVRERPSWPVWSQWVREKPAKLERPFQGYRKPREGPRWSGTGPSKPRKGPLRPGVDALKP